MALRSMQGQVLRQCQRLLHLRLLHLPLQENPLDREVDLGGTLEAHLGHLHLLREDGGLHHLMVCPHLHQLRREGVGMRLQGVTSRTRCDCSSMYLRMGVVMMIVVVVVLHSSLHGIRVNLIPQFLRLRSRAAFAPLPPPPLAESTLSAAEVGGRKIHYL
jgi:hypothetical protein